LAFLDGFAKFACLNSTKTTGCEEVIQRFTEWSNVFGFPKRVVSDRGAVFTSGAFEEWLSVSKIDHVCSITGVARASCQVERINQSIFAVIAKIFAEDPSKWFKYVPQVQKAINSQMNSSTKLSPF